MAVNAPRLPRLRGFLFLSQFLAKYLRVCVVMRFSYILILWSVTACNHPPTITVEPVNSNSSNLLQAISIVDEHVAWVSGHQATFLRTQDGGESWEAFTHSVDSLQFRDVHAFDRDNVLLMSAGIGAASGIYLFSAKTGWEKTYTMPYDSGFLNTIEFWDHQTGLAFGDSFNGQLFVLKTNDGGMHWTRINPSVLPAAGKGEGGFAASGTCITTQPGGKAWIGTGAGGHSRVLYTADYGSSWTPHPSPMPKGDAAGIFSIRMANDTLGILAGGDLGATPDYSNNLAMTVDGGRSWQLKGPPVTKGTFYGTELMHTRKGLLWVVCGPKGMDYSLDGGSSWKTLDTLNYWAVRLDPSGFGYAVGTEGKISRIRFDL